MSKSRFQKIFTNVVLSTVSYDMRLSRCTMECFLPLLFRKLLTRARTCALIRVPLYIISFQARLNVASFHDSSLQLMSTPQSDLPNSFPLSNRKIYFQKLVVLFPISVFKFSAKSIRRTFARCLKVNQFGDYTNLLPLKCSHIILCIFHKCITNGAHDQTLLLKGLYKGATAIGTDTAPEEYTGYPRGGSAAWMVRFLRSVG